MNLVVILVTGSRHLRDRNRVFNTLDKVVACFPLGSTFLLRHGAARGADTLAGLWAAARGHAIDACPADWSKGRGAGHFRNGYMIAREPLPTVCIAFPETDSRGTYDCIRRAKNAGIMTVVC